MHTFLHFPLLFLYFLFFLGYFKCWIQNWSYFIMECFFFKRRAQQPKKTWHSVNVRLVCWKAFRSCHLSLSLLLQLSVIRTLFLPVSLALHVLHFYSVIRLMFSKFPPLWIFSSKVWAYFHTAYHNHLLHQRVPSLEKYTGYILQHITCPQLRSTGQSF